MIHHVVLVRFRPDAGDDRVAAAGDALRRMQGRIPAARSVSWARNQAPSAAEWPWVLLVECDDMEAVAEYLAHSVHQDAVARYMTPVLEARLAVDFEVDA